VAECIKLKGTFAQRNKGGRLSNLGDELHKAKEEGGMVAVMVNPTESGFVKFKIVVFQQQR
jgi:hypothetical protein